MRFFYRLKRAGLVPMDAVLDHYEVYDHPVILVECLVCWYVLDGKKLCVAMSDKTLNLLQIRMVR